MCSAVSSLSPVFRPVTGQIFATRLKDRPGLIKKFTDLIREKGGRMNSIMTSYDDI